MYIQSNNGDVLSDLMVKSIKTIEKNFGLRIHIDFDNTMIRLFKIISGIETEVGILHISSILENGFEFYIVKEYRGKGLGGLLFNLYKRICLEKNNFNFLDTIYLTNTSLIAFFLKKGFILKLCIKNDSKKIHLNKKSKNILLELIESEKNELKKYNRLKGGGEIFHIEKLCKLIYKK